MNKDEMYALCAKYLSEEEEITDDPERPRDRAARRLYENHGIKMVGRTLWQRAKVHSLPDEIKKSGNPLDAVAKVWTKLNVPTKKLLEDNVLLKIELEQLPFLDKPEEFVRDRGYRREVMKILGELGYSGLNRMSGRAKSNLIKQWLKEPFLRRITREELRNYEDEGAD